jgi:hypothetical protein
MNREQRTKNEERRTEPRDIDMSLSESLLQRTVSERLALHDQALAAALDLRAAMERRTCRTSKDS